MIREKGNQMGVGGRGISKLKSQHGAVAIITGLATSLLLIGFGALAIDVGHLYVVRNELQNAADAGALAGARLAYADDPYCRTPRSGVDTVILQAAQGAATTNQSEGVGVEVSAGDVLKGHWSFASRTFTPISEMGAPTYCTSSSRDLDTNFTNAVKVVARRQATPAVSFLAGIFGYTHFEVSAEAVAYFYCRASTCELEVEDLDVEPNTVYLVD